jgi:hypothetical protein
MTPIVADATADLPPDRYRSVASKKGGGGMSGSGMAKSVRVLLGRLS